MPAPDFLPTSTTSSSPHEARRSHRGAGPRFSEAPPAQTTARTRCLACGSPITSGQQVFKIRGLVLHLSCAMYRRRRLRSISQ